jgi:hypothetical protein
MLGARDRAGRGARALLSNFAAVPLRQFNLWQLDRKHHRCDVQSLHDERNAQRSTSPRVNTARCRLGTSTAMYRKDFFSV